MELDGTPYDVLPDVEGDGITMGCGVDFFCPHCLVAVFGWACEDEIQLIGAVVPGDLTKVVECASINTRTGVLLSRSQ